MNDALRQMFYLMMQIAPEGVEDQICEELSVHLVKMRDHIISLTATFNDQIVALNNRDWKAYEDAMQEQQSVWDGIKETINGMKE